MAGCGWADGANRIVTTFDTGRSCNAPILNVGVSCIDAISKAKLSCTAVCMAPAGCGVPPEVLAVGIWIGSGMVTGVVGSEINGPVKTGYGMKDGIATVSRQSASPSG